MAKIIVGFTVWVFNVASVSLSIQGKIEEAKVMAFLAIAFAIFYCGEK